MKISKKSPLEKPLVQDGTPYFGRTVDRAELEREEAAMLAPYALKSGESRGRTFTESEHPYRTAFQRDRARIVHCTAFRRLEYKTQVFVNHEGDYYRTRLTHSLEASQISRVIAKSLRLNADLVETITLAHDLGHTPFGHAGEDELRDLMKNHGGFDHNLQALRIVDFLEERYVEFRGLNLTYETRAGLFKHPELLKEAEKRGMGKFDSFKSPSLESQVVDLADEIAYDNHDLDDGLASGLITEEDLEKIALWSQVRKETGLSASVKPEVRRYQIISGLIDLEVTDLIRTSKANLAAAGLRRPQDALGHDKFLIAFSPALAAKREELRDFLKKNFYRHYRVVRMTDKARRFLKALFGAYVALPAQLPPGSQGRIKTEGVERVVCDYIAGMTDRYAQDEYRKLFEPFEKV